MAESDLVKQICDLLDPECVVIPQNSRVPRNRRTRYRNGSPDLIVFHPRSGGWMLEVKREDGEQNEDQRKFQQMTIEKGVNRYRVVKPSNLSDVIREIVKKMGPLGPRNG